MSFPLALVLRQKQHFSFGGSNAIKFWRLINGIGGGFGGGGNDIRPVIMMTSKLNSFHGRCSSSGGSGTKLFNCLEESLVKIGGGGGYQWRSGMVGCSCEQLRRGFKSCAVYQYAQVILIMRTIINKRVN